MTSVVSEASIRQRVAAWFPSLTERGRGHTNTTDFHQMDYGDVVILAGRPYLVLNNAKEGRFGLDDQEKFWVKRAVDLDSGERKIIKLVFYEKFTACIAGIAFLHRQGEKHGDIRRDYIFIDRENGDFRWIDFDFNYRHRENIYGYDLFGIGNILIYLVGKGDLIVSDLARWFSAATVARLRPQDRNIVFNHRLANLKKIYPYIPEPLNRILLHFSVGAQWHYEHMDQILEDLDQVDLRSPAPAANPLCACLQKFPAALSSPLTARKMHAVRWFMSVACWGDWTASGSPCCT
jgi:hypothetical protein